MKPSTKTDKPKDAKKTLKGLWRYLRQYRGFLLVAILLATGSNLFALIGPMLSGKAIDVITKGTHQVDFYQIFYYAACMIVFYLLSSVLSYVLSALMISISQKFIRHMRKDVFDKLMRLPVGYFDRNQTGDIISKISYDIDVINTSFSTDMVQIFASLITVIGSFAMMIIISPSLSLAMIATIPLAVYYTRYMAKRTRPLFRKRSQKIGELNGFVEEMTGGQKTIAAYAREEIMIQRFDQINQETVDAYYDADFTSSIVGPTINFISNLSLSIVTIAGAALYLYQRITLGDISSFVLYSRKFSGPINEAANIVSELQSALAAAERVFGILEEEEELMDCPEAIHKTDITGEVKMNHVSFGYTKNKMILKNLCLLAKPGSLIAIVGPTGAGKTTIINLLMRFYDVNAGEILVDGVETRAMTRESLRKAFAMVLQDTWIFSGTIFENIAYGKPGATMEEVVRAAKAAKIHSFIEKLPNGYQTVLTEDGINISRGQKQLLTIARAMLLDAKMLILDEATSNVDTRTERHIQKAMRQLMQDKTCFVIAHRLSTIQNADQILVIDNGNIAEQGQHKELLAKNGCYAEMYYSQFQ